VSDVSDARTPLEKLGVLAHQSVDVAPGLAHHELFTMGGLLTVLWHGEPTSPGVVVACGGAMGGLLGPSGGLYHDLGNALAAQGIQTLRIAYRQPNDLSRCVHDAVAAVELACRNGGQSAVVLGHSFGGAVAVQTAIALREVVTGVVTFATQSAGCENADRLAPDLPFLLFHGDRDEILPADCSFIVQHIAGHGEVVVLPGAGHLLADEGQVLLDRLLEFIPACVAVV
jgi:pimeloyl-ACP methyl ester carboxylesterase